MPLSGKVSLAVAVGIIGFTRGQHYCLPPDCTSKGGVIGKYTLAASDPTKCYAWLFKYLNNVVPGSSNNGQGYRNTTSIGGDAIAETHDASTTDVLAMEFNECGLTQGLGINETRPMTDHESELVVQGLRLPTGEMHQCACAVQGRAHIINAAARQREVTAPLRGGDPSLPLYSLAEAEFLAHGGLLGVFGLHFVNCAFHSSGPCPLEQVEKGVARAWQGNFSAGYVPLMDNNIMLWTPTLGPILDLFLRDGVEFYPMRWHAPTEDGVRQAFSVLVSPCGKVLYEIAAPDAGGRAAEEFHVMPMARAVFKDWNEPSTQPLVPLRVSRAVPPALMDRMLKFYGYDGSQRAAALGFNSKIILDETDASGTRAVTLKLSTSSTVHWQLWAAPESELEVPEPWTPGPGGFAQDFAESKSLTQAGGKALRRAESFCLAGDWSVARYSWYVRQTHEATLSPIPSNTSTPTPPTGEPMNSFMDDHISWDCTAEECELGAASSALFESGSRITYMGHSSSVWWPYSYDPAGYGIQLHWFNQVESFRPAGEAPPICFLPQSEEGACVSSSAQPATVV